MDENLFESMQYAAWVFLFIFALSFGIYQYNRMDAVIDQFVAVNMFNDRGTGTGVFLDESDVKRKVTRAEVIMSIMNLPDTVNQNGNVNYHIKVVKPGGQYTAFHFFEDPANPGWLGVEAASSWLAYRFIYILQGAPTSALVGGYRGPERLIHDMVNNSYFPGDINDVFEVEYTENSINFSVYEDV